ncbi:ABC transporter permease subunit [Thermocatellispora tengchongensis]
MVASLAMAVLGMLAITSEHATGMIRATYAAIPDRRRVLAAKAAVVGAVALVTGQVTVLGTAALEKLIVAGRPIRGQSAQSIAEQLPHILAMGLMVAVFALFGLGLGAILRSTPGALSTLAGLWYVLPIVVNNLPEPWHEWVGSVLPGALAGQLAGTGNPNSVYGSSLPPAAALAVMAAYAVVPLAVAVHLDRRRDT